MKPYVSKQNKLKLFVRLNWWFVSLITFTYFSKMTIFTQNILQGSVATHLRCGGIFCSHFTTNLLT